jgi:cytochrome P450
MHPGAGRRVAVGADLSREQAIEVLRAAARRYREHHP